jgi:hypothetical protein
MPASFNEEILSVFDGLSISAIKNEESIKIVAASANISAIIKKIELTILILLLL